jgi:hypothetical protein
MSRVTWLKSSRLSELAWFRSSRLFGSRWDLLICLRFVRRSSNTHLVGSFIYDFSTPHPPPLDSLSVINEINAPLPPADDEFVRSFQAISTGERVVFAPSRICCFPNSIWPQISSASHVTGCSTLRFTSVTRLPCSNNPFLAFFSPSAPCSP